MRKFLISAALAASTLIAAAPAAAQWYPQQQQGYGYGYQNNYGQARRLQVRIDQLQRQINQLDSRNILSGREAAQLRNQSRDLERQLRYSARNGLNGRESYGIERGIQRLEVRIQREARDGNRYAYNNGYYGGRDGNYGNRDNWSDRDRDGRNDRYEDDQGQDHDD
jgi:opacity protein-like surface antigen